MLHLSNIHKLVERGEFSLEFVKKDGTIVKADRCVCSSFHSAGRTLNIKFCDSEEIRKVSLCTIIKYNDEEVCL